MTTGYTSVQVQVLFVAALDSSGDIAESWWAFAPDEADLAGSWPGNPDRLSWKLTAKKIDGSTLKGVAFARTGGVVVDWPWDSQPTRKSDSEYVIDVNNYNSSGNPAGPYKFTVELTYKGQPVKSPDPDVVLESRPD